MRYTTDLSDLEWQLLQNYFPKPAPTGRPRKHSYRELLNARFYLVRTSCQRRNRPKDFAPWGTVYHYFRRWKKSGLWERMHTRCVHVGDRESDIYELSHTAGEIGNAIPGENLC